MSKFIDTKKIGGATYVVKERVETGWSECGTFYTLGQAQRYVDELRDYGPFAIVKRREVGLRRVDGGDPA